MKKRAPYIFSAALIFLPISVKAQLVDTWRENRLFNARIRDRNIKFSSPRLEALQMSVAIEDETNALDLDTWGDNRAWLGASVSNLAEGGTSHTRQMAVARAKRISRAEPIRPPLLEIDLPGSTTSGNGIKSEKVINEPKGAVQTIEDTSANLTPAREEPLTNSRIVSMVRSGVGDDTILALISQSPSELDASLEALMDLVDAGISDTVIKGIKRHAVRHVGGAELTKKSSEDAGGHSEGVVPKHNQVKVEAALGDQKTGQEMQSYTGVGAYVRYGNIEVEGLRRSLKHDDPSNLPPYTAEYTNSEAGVGWGHNFGGLLAGIHWDELYAHDTLTYPDETDIYISYYRLAGVAIATKLGPSFVGGTMDLVHFEGLDGVKYGVQTIIGRNELKAGFRASVMPLTRDYTSWGNRYSETETHKELGGRILWVVPGLPVNLGAEYSNTYVNVESIRNGQLNYNSSSIGDTITAGVMLDLLSERLMIGGEYEHVRINTYIFNAYTAGTEIKPSKDFSLRGAYQHLNGAGTRDKSNIFTAGLGYRLNVMLSGDIAYRRIKNNDYSSNDGHLSLSAHF